MIRRRMKITPKIAIVVGIALLSAGGLCANRYSMVCPVHHVLAGATGSLRANGTECEFRHSMEKGKMHTFWAKCDQLGLGTRESTLSQHLPVFPRQSFSLPQLSLVAQQNLPSP
jgi:hypothetical protein